MINEHLNETSAHAIITQVASYFDAVDNAVKTGDTNKRYAMTTNSCTAPSAPIQNASFTNVVISPTADNMADLYNSYIVADLQFDVKRLLAHTGLNTAGYNKVAYWVGFKDSAQAIAQYQILANGQVIYNQTNAIEEFYVTSCADTDLVKKTDVFSRARHKDIWQKVDTVRTGCIVPVSVAANTETVTAKMTIKIDVRRFLPLATVKFLPAFVGNLSLRVQFSPDALVCAPLSLEDILQTPALISFVQSDYTISNRFVPVGEQFDCIDHIVVTGTPVTAITVTKLTNQVLNVSNFVVTKCESIVPCFGLDDYLYQQLVQRYSGEALSFPIQTLNFQQMNVSGVGTANINATISATPKFVDNIFLLFGTGSRDRTCRLNPFFDQWQLKMGGYGSVPDISISTYGAQFYELMCNAYNVNNDISCFNDDVMKSLTQIVSNGGTLAALPKTGYKSNDVTNFILSIPCSTDGTYQQGQTSSTPITYQFTASVNNVSPYKNSCVAMMGMLKDSVFAIQVRPNSTPIVVVDEADITSPQ